MSGDPVAEAELPDGMWAQLVAALKRLLHCRLALLPPDELPGQLQVLNGHLSHLEHVVGDVQAWPSVRQKSRHSAAAQGLVQQENSHFDTLVGLVSNVAGHQVAQQMERGFEAAQQLAQQAQRAASKRMDRGEAPAPQSFSRRLQEASAAIASFSFADWAVGAPDELQDVNLIETLRCIVHEKQEVPDQMHGHPENNIRFSLYIAKTADSPERPGRAPPVSVAPPRAAAPEDEPPTPPPQPPSREAMLLALQEDDVDEAPEVCFVPYGLVAQVTSLGSGTVRLSWLFDWEAAPADLAEALEPSGLRILSWDNTATGTKRLRSAMVCRRFGGCGEHKNPQPFKVSSVSGVTCRWSVSSPGQSCFDQRRSSALVLKQFCSRRCRPTEGKPKQKGRVAANFNDFLKRTPATSTASAAKNNAKVVMGGSTKVQLGASGPLSSVHPRVVNAGPLDPATEKREMAERIRLRSGQAG
eukprot:g25780.t2